MRNDDKGRGQRGPRVKFPDEAVALSLPIEVAVSLYFAEGVAVGTRGQGSPEVKEGRSRLDIRQYVLSPRQQANVRINKVSGTTGCT